MSFAPAVVFICLSCYLIGATPFGYLVGRARGIDIRSVGSGNIGATNVGRILGKPWGLLVFVLDVAKGLAPTLTVGTLLESWSQTWSISGMAVNILWLGGGICCILGHNFPVYLRFRGGKGVATSLGIVLGVYPYLTVAGLLAFAVWLIVTVATRTVSLGSICAAVALPLLLAACTLWENYSVFAENLPVLGFATLASALVIYRHRENIKRLRAGTERRIGEQRQASSAMPLDTASGDGGTGRE
jgi:glycerol-3-phosphate acyltransferase PlsY